LSDLNCSFCHHFVITAGSIELNNLIIKLFLVSVIG